MHPLTYTQLGQFRENSTNATSIYQSNDGETVQLFIKIANVSSQTAFVRVFHDYSGTTYNQSTAIVYDLKIVPGEFLELDHIFINDSTGNVAYRSSAANALTATVYGIIR